MTQDDNKLHPLPVDNAGQTIDESYRKATCGVPVRAAELESSQRSLEEMMERAEVVMETLESGMEVDDELLTETVLYLVKQDMPQAFKLIEACRPEAREVYLLLSQTFKERRMWGPAGDCAKLASDLDSSRDLYSRESFRQWSSEDLPAAAQFAYESESPSIAIVRYGEHLKELMDPMLKFTSGAEGRLKDKNYVKAAELFELSGDYAVESMQSVYGEEAKFDSDPERVQKAKSSFLPCIDRTMVVEDFGNAASRLYQKAADILKEQMGDDKDLQDKEQKVRLKAVETHDSMVRLSYTMARDNQ